MSCPELPKTYDFKETEEKLYRDWNDAGYFQPWNDPKKAGFDPSVPPYVISIPPANVTGELHNYQIGRASCRERV